MPDFLKSLTLNGVAPGGGSVTATQAEIDVGATPVPEAEIAVSDAAATATKAVFATISHDTPTGKDADDVPMDAYNLVGVATTGSITFKLRSLEGFIHDKYKIDYLLG